MRPLSFISKLGHYLLPRARSQPVFSWRLRITANGGENAGRTLQHVAVLRKLTRIGNVDASAEFSRDINLGLSPKTQGNLRIVVIVQEPEVGRVWGAGLTRLSNQY